MRKALPFKLIKIKIYYDTPESRFKSKLFKFSFKKFINSNNANVVILLIKNKSEHKLKSFDIDNY